MDRLLVWTAVLSLSAAPLFGQADRAEEDPRGRLIADSFHHALIVAMHSSPPGAHGARVPVQLVHDGLPGRDFRGEETFPPGSPSTGQELREEMYVFELPSDKEGGVPIRFPTKGTGSPGLDGEDRFRMAGERGSLYLRECLAGGDDADRKSAAPGSVWSRDPGDDLDTYQVDFVVVRVVDAGGSAAQPLFEFRIRVYRADVLLQEHRTLIAGN